MNVNYGHCRHKCLLRGIYTVAEASVREVAEMDPACRKHPKLATEVRE
jgi:hypothetical protein